MKAFDFLVLAVLGTGAGLFFSTNAHSGATREAAEKSQASLAQVQYQIERLAASRADDAKKIEKLEAQAELARAEAIRQKAKADQLQDFFAEMYKQGMLPLVPLPDLIPPQKLPTKPID